jgi:hypothetical protein
VYRGPGAGRAAYHLWDGRRGCDHSRVTFAKMLVLILGLAATAFAVRTALTGTMGSDTAAHSAPRRQLDSVRERARALEREQQKAAEAIAASADAK